MAYTERGPGHAWDARFKEPLDEGVKAFLASVAFDRRLAWADIAGSIAHATMLGRCGIIGTREATMLAAGLRKVWAGIRDGTVQLSPDLEDVHMNVEALLREDMGEVADMLHTGRSRNDQVALDLRLYTREHMVATIDAVIALQRALLSSASGGTGGGNGPSAVVVQGHTHLQPAQPVLLAHVLHAHTTRLGRDVARLEDALGRVSASPLGAGAIAGTSLPISPEVTAELLGLEATFGNSMDAVSDRDFVLEALSCLTQVMLHLSGLCEELVLWSSDGWVRLPDSVCTGSSMMPQKRNPDVPELVRGKTGRVVGSLVGVATMLKGLPMAYNKDLQEDKEALFDAFDTVEACLSAMTKVVTGLEVVPGAIHIDPNSMATDLAEHLVSAGVPFREAHRTVGGLVLWCEANGVPLDQVDLATLRSFSVHFDEGALSLLTPEGSVGAKVSPGGTGPAQVAAALETARKDLEVASASLAAQKAAALRPWALLDDGIDGVDDHVEHH